MTRTKRVLLPGLDGTEIFFSPLLIQLPSWIDPVVVTYPATGPNAYDDLVPIVDWAVESLTDFVILGPAVMSLEHHIRSRRISSAKGPRIFPQRAASSRASASDIVCSPPRPIERARPASMKRNSQLLAHPPG